MAMGEWEMRSGDVSWSCRFFFLCFSFLLSQLLLIIFSRYHALIFWQPSPILKTTAISMSHTDSHDDRGQWGQGSETGDNANTQEMLTSLGHLVCFFFLFHSLFFFTLPTFTNFYRYDALVFNNGHLFQWRWRNEKHAKEMGQGNETGDNTNTQEMLTSLGHLVCFFFLFHSLFLLHYKLLLNFYRYNVLISNNSHLYGGMRNMPMYVCFFFFSFSFLYYWSFF